MVSFTQKGDFSKTLDFLKRTSSFKGLDILKKYGEIGVQALSEATPVDTGLTASSWYYKIIEGTNNTITLQFCNSNVKDYVPIAVILQYGHATKSGTWIEGRDYINPAITPVFDKMSEDIWKEVTK